MSELSTLGDNSEEKRCKGRRISYYIIKIILCKCIYTCLTQSEFDQYGVDIIVIALGRY